MTERGPAMNPDLDRDESFSSILSRFEDQVLRFTMPPPDDNAYDDETINDFLGQVPLYDEFRRQMRLLIIHNPDYAQVAHLRVFWNFLYRGFIGEEQVDDNFLFLYPAVMFVLHDSFLDFFTDGRDSQETHFGRPIAMEPQTEPTALHDRQAAHLRVRSYRETLVEGKASSRPR